MPIDWQPAKPPYSEQAIKGDYKLVILAERRAADNWISWVMFGPPDHANPIQWGSCETLAEAKAEAEEGLPRRN